MTASDDREWLISDLTIQVLAEEAIRHARREFVDECRRREAQSW